MSYFRAIVHKKETSDRALELTQEVIEMNNGNYQAWYWRRVCLDALNTSMDEEIEWLNEVGIDMEKSY